MNTESIDISVWQIYRYGKQWVVGSRLKIELLRLPYDWTAYWIAGEGEQERGQNDSWWRFDMVSPYKKLLTYWGWENMPTLCRRNTIDTILSMVQIIVQCQSGNELLSEPMME